MSNPIFWSHKFDVSSTMNCGLHQNDGCSTSEQTSKWKISPIQCVECSSYPRPWEDSGPFQWHVRGDHTSRPGFSHCSTNDRGGHEWRGTGDPTTWFDDCSTSSHHSNEVCHSQPTHVWCSCCITVLHLVILVSLIVVLHWNFPTLNITMTIYTSISFPRDHHFNIPNRFSLTCFQVIFWFIGWKDSYWLIVMI